VLWLGWPEALSRDPPTLAAGVENQGQCAQPTAIAMLVCPAGFILPPSVIEAEPASGAADHA